MARCIVCYKQRDLDKSARVAVDDPCSDVIEENKLSKRENDLIKQFLAKREKALQKVLRVEKSTQS